MISRSVKRVIDLAGATVGLVVTAPVMAGTAAAIAATMGRPVIFRQERPGYREEPFTLMKFRTMRAPREDEVWFRSDEDRLTAVGRFIRKTSIDELPTLWNVLKGEMSLVGPRPLLLEYLPNYTDEQHRRHDVLPGITGLAQVNGRQNISFSKRLQYDIWYVDNWSLWLDIKVLFKTLFDVFVTRGVVPGQDVDEVDDLGLTPDDSGE
jgi:sugar transferase EpsL